MTTRGFAPSVAAIACALASPHTLAGQTPSSRPASIALTVIVPANTISKSGVAADGATTIVSRTPTRVDLITMVGLRDRPASRVEVRLSDTDADRATRVWVRNADGQFERLTTHVRTIALHGQPSVPFGESPLHYRIEMDDSFLSDSVAVPVEYRLTIGSGDQIAVWTFPSVLRATPRR